MPTPIAAYDPTRRIFIGGLSPQTTTKDIIAAIKTKTKALPTHVEIALSKKLNTAQQKEKDPLAPAAPITRRRKPKIKIPGCSSSDDDDEILHMNYKKKPDQQQQQQQQQQQSVGQDAAVAKNDDKNNNNNNSDDSDNDDTKQQNNNKKGNTSKNNKDAAAAGGEKKPLRDCRGFAHVTVEGLKQVTEQLHGVMVNDKPIRVSQAKPHYLWKLENVKRQQEKEDEKKQSEVESIRSKEGYGELDYTKPLLRSTTAAKAKFGKIASQIADKLRQKAKERKQKMKAMNARQQQFQQQYQQGGGNPKFGATRRPREDDGSSQKHPDSNKKPFNNANRNASAGGKGGKKDSNKKEAAAAPPPPPPEPTKQDRKLSALEARLAALQAKLKKK